MRLSMVRFGDFGKECQGVFFDSTCSLDVACEASKQWSAMRLNRAALLHGVALRCAASGAAMCSAIAAAATSDGQEG